MNHFPISFQYAGTNYTGFILPCSGSVCKEIPTRFFVYINGFVWRLEYVFDFWLYDRPELSDVLGSIVVSWWDGITK